MTPCRCRIVDGVENALLTRRADVWSRKAGWGVVFCPLHRHAEAMREVLRRCAEGAFLMEQRGELINLAQQVLAKIDAEASPL